MTHDPALWWQRGIVYQVYPRSFQDSNGDGIGDLPGILQRLDYLEWLGIDALWISPIYPSPMADFGYDVSDYLGIHPLFGTMADFDRLLAELHRRGMKLILDFVPNHTSDRHLWFVESRSSRDSPKRSYYLWRDPAPGGGPPNNWLSVFGGSAWEWDESTGQYYYHAFLKEQPDLDWRNPEVVEAMLEVLRFWFDKGVDGFRVDVMWHLIKDLHLRDNPENPDYKPSDPEYERLIPAFSTDQAEVHPIVARMRRLADRYSERLLIGEIYLPIHKLVAYYGEDGSGAHLPFNFTLITAAWDARTLDAAIAEYEGALPIGGWPNWVLGNHDKPRIATRVGMAQARVAAVMLLTLRGTPTIYYGDEIGMRDVPILPHQVRDPQEIREPGLGLGRDPPRTPMQWSSGYAAGFTTGEPWLPVSEELDEHNVEAERDDPGSFLTLYRRLIALRRSEPALQVGEFSPIAAHGDVIAYLRELGARRFLVALNLGHAPGRLGSDRLELRGGVRLSTHRAHEGSTVAGTITLAGDEGMIVELDPA
jgi:alpha-glucosidase